MRLRVCVSDVGVFQKTHFAKVNRGNKLGVKISFTGL